MEEHSSAGISANGSNHSEVVFKCSPAKSVPIEIPETPEVVVERRQNAKRSNVVLSSSSSDDEEGNAGSASVPQHSKSHSSKQIRRMAQLDSSSDEDDEQDTSPRPTENFIASDTDTIVASVAGSSVLQHLIDTFPHRDQSALALIAASANSIEHAVNLVLDDAETKRTSGWQKVSSASTKGSTSIKSRGTGARHSRHHGHGIQNSVNSNSKRGATNAASSDEDSMSDMDSEGSDDDGNAWGDYKPETISSALKWFNTASAASISAFPRMNDARAELVLRLRPFRSWEALIAKLENTPKLSSAVAENVCERVDEQSVLDRVLTQCSKIAVTLKEHIEEVVGGGHVHAGASEDGYVQAPSSLSSGCTLRPFQLVGLRWLALLYRQNVSAILADEMGLGKTVQTIAFLTHLRDEGVEGNHLIIVPSSVLDNWLREFTKWSPSLRICCLRGSLDERMQIRGSMKKRPQNYDVCLTTYNVATGKHDRGLFKKIGFKCVVFDEGHMLKNYHSERYKVLTQIKAISRILLTGTPLQNNLKELLSLLNFIMPKVFAKSTKHLLNFFGRPVKDNPDPSDPLACKHSAMVGKARDIMEPFILCRKKENVLTDLPPKKNCVELSVLLPDQRSAYDDLVQQFKEKVLAKAAKEGKDAVSTVVVGSQDDAVDNSVVDLAGLGSPKQKHSSTSHVRNTSSLESWVVQARKLANHPLLHRIRYDNSMLAEMATSIMREDVYETANEQYIYEDMEVMSDFELHNLCKRFKRTMSKYMLQEPNCFSSGKFETLTKMLPKLIAQGHRMLIFSQFVMMLDIMDPFLRSQGYSFLRIDGSTPVDERQALIDRYTNDTTIPVFLLSTRAGGLGINLIAADTVIIHDIDYNPQQDKQAEDRCHRVGQTKPVTIYRLIAKDTIEEKILGMAEHKLNLEKEVSSTGEGGVKLSVMQLLNIVNSDETPSSGGAAAAN